MLRDHVMYVIEVTYMKAVHIGIGVCCNGDYEKTRIEYHSATETDHIIAPNTPAGQRLAIAHSTDRRIHFTNNPDKMTFTVKQKLPIDAFYEQKQY